MEEELLKDIKETLEDMANSLSDISESLVKFSGRTREEESEDEGPI